MTAEMLAGLALCLCAIVWALDIRAEAQAAAATPTTFTTRGMSCHRYLGEGWTCRIDTKDGVWVGKMPR